MNSRGADVEQHALCKAAQAAQHSKTTAQHSTAQHSRFGRPTLSRALLIRPMSMLTITCRAGGRGELEELGVHGASSGSSSCPPTLPPNSLLQLRGRSAAHHAHHEGCKVGEGRGPALQTGSTPGPQASFAHQVAGQAPPTHHSQQPTA